MNRNRCWRRYKNYTKAKRKKDIDLNIQYYWNDAGGIRVHPWYSNLNQYSKNKIHCSCPLCSAKTNNKGKRKRKNYAPSWNPKLSDLKKEMSMQNDLISSFLNIENN